MSGAAARGLFDDGRALLAKKDYAHACPKFEESQRLDPGGGTLLNLALCHELLGKTATAWAEFAEALRVADQDDRPDRREFAERHIEGLRSHLSRLRVVIAEAARVPGLGLRRNGVELGPAAWGGALAVDPGEQVIEASAPGKIAARVAIQVGADGDVQEFVLEPLKDAPAPNGPSLVEPTAPPRPDSVSAFASTASERKEDLEKGSTQRLIGGVTAGIGIAALGVGTYLAVRTIGFKSSADRDCPNPANCQPEGIRESRNAVKYADTTTGVVATGVLFTGLGGYLILSAPRIHARRLALQIGFGGTELCVSGQY